MKIDYSATYKRSEKGLKKRYEEQKTLEMLKNHIKMCEDFHELKNHPFSIQYGFEPLKYELSGKYSFNVNKNGGTIRLILSFKESENLAILEEVSIKHYKKH